MSFYGSRSYFSDVALGLVPGRRVLNILGRNQALQAGVYETLWDGGGNYTYLSSDTQLYVSSSSASDTAVGILTTGLDDSYEEAVRTATTGGQSQVALSGDLFRVHAALTTGTNQPVGNLYIAESDTLTGGVPDDPTKIKAIIPLNTEGDAGIYGSDSISHNALYTVPANHTLLIHEISGEVGKDEDAIISGRFRTLGNQFLNRNEISVYQNRFDAEFRLPAAIPSMADIEFRGKASAAGSTGSISAICELVDLDSVSALVNM